MLFISEHFYNDHNRDKALTVHAMLSGMTLYTRHCSHFFSLVCKEMFSGCFNSFSLSLSLSLSVGIYIYITLSSLQMMVFFTSIVFC